MVTADQYHSRIWEQRLFPNDSGKTVEAALGVLQFVFPKTKYAPTKLAELVIHAAAEKFRRKNTTAKHRNWYPTEVGRLLLPLARLICQRAAVWWDMSQRRKYAGWLVLIVAVLVLGVVAVSFTADQRVRDMVLSVYLPIAPAVVWRVLPEKPGVGDKHPAD